MTDRYYALTVILERDIRTDDAEAIINAIKMIRGVLNVKGEISNVITLVAEERAQFEFGQFMLKLINENWKNRNDRQNDSQNDSQNDR